MYNWRNMVSQIQSAVQLPETIPTYWVLVSSCIITLLILTVLVTLLWAEWRWNLLQQLRLPQTFQNGVLIRLRNPFHRPQTASAEPPAEPEVDTAVPAETTSSADSERVRGREGEEAFAPTSPTSSDEQAQAKPGQLEIRSLAPIWVLLGLGVLLFLCCAATAFLGSYLTGQNDQDATATAETAAAATSTAVALATNITATVPIATVTPTPIPNPTTCAAIREQNPEAADGEYTLYLDGNIERPVTIYCHDMDSFPLEYLTLINTGGPSNYSMISYPEGALVTQYQKLRINPATLIVDRSDKTFATYPDNIEGYSAISNVENYPVIAADYARAEGCSRGDPEAPPGQANIDLTGTDFALSQTVEFTFEGGAVQDPVVEISQDRRIVDLSISGRCAHIEPADELRLTYVLTQPEEQQ